jgi:hypothetical protein
MQFTACVIIRALEQPSSGAHRYFQAETNFQKAEFAWPSGAKQRFENFPADHLRVFEESEAIISRRGFPER